MGSFNASIIPASSGLSLGNQNQVWTAYLQDVFGVTLQSSSPNTALSGTIRLASTDSIAWRNAANTADLLFFKTSVATGTQPADTLYFQGSGVGGPFISEQPEPASAGEIRLATGDQLNFRNAADSGDVPGLSLDSQNRVNLGDANGIVIQGILNTGFSLIQGNEQVTGVLVANGGLVGPTLFPVSSTTTPANDLTISGGTTTATAPTVGGDVIIAGGAGTTQGIIQLNSNLKTTGKLLTYNGATLVNAGVPSEVATVNLTGQTAAVTTATLFTTVTAGQYRLAWNAKITTVAGSSSTLGALTIVYTDPDGVSITLTCGAMIAAGTIATTSTANTTGTVLIGLPLLLNCKAATIVSYAMAYASSAANIMTYNLNISLEAM